MAPAPDRVTTAAERDARAAAEFAERRVLELPDLFAPDFQAMLARALAGSRFVPDEIHIPGSRLREESPCTGPLLCWLLGRPALRRWIETITATAPLAAVGGATARFEAGGGQHLDWHNDLVADHKRMLAVTVNLGTAPYEGGCFEMKRRGADTAFLRYAHVKPYAALIFAIDDTLMHRVTPVTAGGPRTVFGGWFLSEPVARP
ncbi:MAG TPA: 2OG-Fe(II) oxygenase [Rhizomicrobium sp.]